MYVKNCIAAITLIFLLAVNLNAQNQRFFLRGFLCPSICQSPTFNRTIVDSKVTESYLEKSTTLFWGGGFEGLVKIKNSWLIGCDVDFTSKGYLATKDVTYSNGSLSGNSFRRTDMNFLESNLFVEKQFQIPDSKCTLLCSAGLFYGIHVPNIIGIGLELEGNDFGSSLCTGIKWKSAVFKLDYRNGMKDIDNKAKAIFRTNILRLQFGYTLF